MTVSAQNHTGTPAQGALEPLSQGFEHRLDVRVYYEDTDFSGLVYHARYLQFMERGRSDFLRCAGVEHAALLARPDPLVFAVYRMEITFAGAARIDDALVVATRFTALNGARIAIQQQVFCRGGLLISAGVEIVCLTPEGRARRAPRDLIAVLGPYLAPQMDGVPICK